VTDRRRIGIMRLPHAEGLDLPARATEGAAGFDLRAAVPAGSVITLKIWGRALVPTGFALQLPLDWEAQVRPRSGLALKHGVTVLNAPGTIDADYRGEIQVLLVNLGDGPFTVERGDRIAQLVFAKVANVELAELGSIAETARGAGGFGSTGHG
jgi:dUTP pyrophosphatase